LIKHYFHFCHIPKAGISSEISIAALIIVTKRKERDEGRERGKKGGKEGRRKKERESSNKEKNEIT
jgi:hypothetical protein